MKVKKISKLKFAHPWNQRISDFAHEAKRNNTSAYLVGGCVRDFYLRKKLKELDVTVEGPAANIAVNLSKKWDAELLRFPQFLTFKIKFSDGTNLDIATTRKETYPHPAALPIVEPSNIFEDLHRRDFSVNSMAVSLTNENFGFLLDPFFGKKDLKKKKIRVLHPNSFKDDPTRIFRAARYAGRYSFKIELKTLKLIKESVSKGFIRLLSPARRRNELKVLLDEYDPSRAFKILFGFDAMKYINPNWRWEENLRNLLGPIKTDIDKEIYRIMILSRNEQVTSIRESLKTLEFPSSIIEQVCQGINVLNQIKSNNINIENKFSRLTPTVRKFLAVSLKKNASWKKYEMCEPKLTGKDIEELGIPAGPQYKSIFESIIKARWKSEIVSKNDERKFVVENFLRGH